MSEIEMPFALLDLDCWFFPQCCGSRHTERVGSGASPVSLKPVPAYSHQTALCTFHHLRSTGGNGPEKPPGRADPLQLGLSQFDSWNLDSRDPSDRAASPVSLHESLMNGTEGEAADRPPPGTWRSIGRYLGARFHRERDSWFSRHPPFRRISTTCGGGNATPRRAILYSRTVHAS